MNYNILRNTTVIWAPCGLALVMLSTSVAAQSATGLEQVIKSATVAMPIATAPASFLLGASGENVPRLASFREFTTQAARAFDDKGKLSNAVAVEVAPALAMGTTSWDDITRHTGYRIWSRTMVSFATKVASEKQGGQSAIGLQSILWAPAMDAALDKVATDPNCRSIIDNADTASPIMGADGKPIPAGLPAASVALMKTCQVEIDGLLTKWNQSMVALGGGRTFAGSTEEGVTRPTDQTAYWITAALGGDFKNKSDKAQERNGYLVTGHYRRTTKVPTKATDGTESPATQQLSGVNGRFGNGRFAFIVEYSSTQSRAAGSSFDDRKRSVVGLEFKLGKEDMYLTLGTARDTGLPQSQQSLLAKFNWGFGNTPTLLAK